MGRQVEDLDPRSPEQIEARRRFGPTAVLRVLHTGAVEVRTLQKVFRFRNYFDYKELDLCVPK